MHTCSDSIGCQHTHTPGLFSVNWCSISIVSKSHMPQVESSDALANNSRSFSRLDLMDVQLTLPLCLPTT